MFGLFKSKETKEVEAIVAVLDQIANEAQTEIQHMERQFSRSQKLMASVHIRRAVMSFPRDVDAVRQLRSWVIDLNKAGRMPQALGAAIGSRLVLAGVFLKQLRGKAWIEAAFSVAVLEGLIKGFMERAGDNPLPGHYAFDIEFERYRLEYLARRDAENESSEAEQ